MSQQQIIKTEIEKATSFTKVLKAIKYIRKSLPKEMQDMYIEKLKKIVEINNLNMNKWGNTSYIHSKVKNNEKRNKVNKNVTPIFILPLLCWSKILLGFFHSIVWKKAQMELFGQLNTYVINSLILFSLPIKHSSC